MTREPSTHYSQLYRAFDNDQQAMVELLKLYQSLVFVWCRSEFGCQQADADDIAQWVILKLLDGGGQKFTPDGQPGAFRRWLYTVTKNRVIDVVRRAGTDVVGQGGEERWDVEAPQDESQSVWSQSGVFGSEAGETPSRRQVLRERRLLFREALRMIDGELSELHRQLFWAYLDGRKASDVAAEFGVETGLVYTVKSRMMNRVRRRFGVTIDVGLGVPEGDHDVLPELGADREPSDS